MTDVISGLGSMSLNPPLLQTQAQPLQQLVSVSRQPIDVQARRECFRISANHFSGDSDTKYVDSMFAAFGVARDV